MAAEQPHAPEAVRVVIADDSGEMRSLVRWALERGDGVRVVGEAAEAHEALALVEDLAPDALVLDLQMPGLTAAAMLERLAAAAPSVPIITFSGYEPEHVAPEHAHLVRLHVPKTTDLALVRDAVVAIGRRSA